MSEQAAVRFDTRAECEAQFRACLAASSAQLQLFDPDFAVFPLGAREVDAALRAFLAGGGTVQLAMHSPAHIERHYPRFLRLLRDYSHLLECRVTGRGLRQLTDSFCIGDGVHIVRRYHSDYPRGETAFGAASATELARERFAAIWDESRPALAPSTTGL
ncbi:MAG: hypothetical protein ACJ8LG_21930 [Massilia sp.]